MNSSQKIANIIKELAKSRKVSVAKMLADCQLNKNSLYTMQTEGYSPRVDTLVKIADYLDCSIDYLLGRDAPSVNNVTGSNGVVIGKTNEHITINNGQENLSDLERELLKVFAKVDMKDKLKIMHFAYEVEEKGDK